MYYTSYSTPENKDNPALLLCHGFPDNSLLWNDVLTHLDDLNILSKYKVIVLDMLGYAGTAKPLGARLYCYKGMADELRDVLDAEDVHKVIVVGPDRGAVMAQRFYPFYTDRVSKIVLCNIAYHPPSKNSDPRFDLKAANEMLGAAFGAPLWTYWEFFASDDGPLLMRDNLQKVYEAQHGDVEDWGFKIFCVPDAWRKWKDSFFGQFRRDGFEAPIQWYKAMMENIQYEDEIYIPLEKHRIEVPVLFIGCTQDGNNRVEFIDIPRNAGLLLKLEVQQLECGHWSPMEKPAEVAGFIAQFIR